MFTYDKFFVQYDKKIICHNLSITVFPGSIFCFYGFVGNEKDFFLEQTCLLKNLRERRVIYNDIINYVKDDIFKNSLTVLQNIEFWARNYNNTLSISMALRYFNLESLADIKYKDVSLSDKKNLYLVMLFIIPSQLWFLTDPFIDRNDFIKVQLYNLIKIRAKEGGVVIMTSCNAIELPGIQNINIRDFY